MKYTFIYNAKGGIFNSMMDTVQKAVNPDGYDCNLCKLTHSAFSMKNEWKDFIKQYNVIFKHKDEVKYDDAPACYDEKGNLVISSKEINSCKNLKELMLLVKRKLEQKRL